MGATLMVKPGGASKRKQKLPNRTTVLLECASGDVHPDTVAQSRCLQSQVAATY